MDVRLQAKLLRAIQERVIDRVGGSQPVRVDIRILATSNRNLADEVKKGTFREDLFYRLNVVHLRLPALRERPADILELAHHFTRKYAEANGLPVRALSADAKRLVTKSPWKGNVRNSRTPFHGQFSWRQVRRSGPTRSRRRRGNRSKPPLPPIRPPAPCMRPRP